MSESKLKAEMFVKRKERKEEIQTWDLIEVGQGRTNHSRIKTTMPILAILIVRTIKPHPIRAHGM